MNSISLLAAAAAILAAGYLAIAFAIAHRFTCTRRGETGGACGSLTPTNVRFASRCGRQRIAAWYFAAGDAQGAVVLVHGRHAGKGSEVGDGQDASALVESLLRRRLSVVMIDLRGHGASTGSRLSYGHNERLDVLGAVDWLRGRGYAEGRIGVLGASMGGAAVIAAAAEEPAIGAVVSDSAFADFGDILDRNFPQAFPLPGAMLFLAGALLIARLLTGAPFGRFAPKAYAEQLRDRPTLVVHSSGDRMIPPAHAEMLAEAAQGELWITESLGHVGSFAACPQAYVDRIGSFFESRLAVRAALAA